MANNRRLRSARNIFLLNLILTDLLLVLTAVPVTPWYALTKNWQFGSAMCHIMPLSNSCSVNYILIGMVATFICCWLPLTAVNLVKDYKIEPAFLRAQPFLWPLMAHVIAMSLVVWNPVLFFWLTRKQKRSGLSKIINSSEKDAAQIQVVSSFASRLGHSIRRMSGRNDSKTDNCTFFQDVGDIANPIPWTDF
ncbi:hypothetical protein OSTOST_12286, partial [Ostertagia ostertagi]